MRPLTAAQILLINLMTDGVPALALAFDRTPGVAHRHADIESFQRRRIVDPVSGHGHDLGVERMARHRAVVRRLSAVEASRHTWMRPLRNPYLHAAVIAGVVVQFAEASLPFTSDLLGNTALPLELWGVVFGGALLAWALAEACARLAWRQLPSDGGRR